MAKRSPFIAGNWKMNMLTDEARKLVRQIASGVGEFRNVRVAVCPPFTSLAAVREIVKETSIALGAQNCHHRQSGAFTGEVSAVMLKDAGVEYVILGHSERRQYFAESDKDVNEKIKAVLEAGLQAIVCVGETENEREKGITEKVIDTQVRGCLSGLGKDQVADSITIAYEPVWAIGTGKTATPELAQEVHFQIRSLLGELFDGETASSVAIQYGGSMKPENAGELLDQADIDGGLIGGASLKAESFLKLVEQANERGR